MSRIGRAPITIPAGVEITVSENNHITVKGPKGTLERTLVPSMSVEIDGGVLHVKRPDDSKENRSLHGLTRTLIDNMVKGAAGQAIQNFNIRFGFPEDEAISMLAPSF